MNILILTIGSRGDVQPYLALGRGLRGAGQAIGSEDGVAQAVAAIERIRGR